MLKLHEVGYMFRSQGSGDDFRASQSLQSYIRHVITVFYFID
ncbi:hypothetical protein VCHA38O210_40117 [Vibrio chagasii]|nr:hypothetical protein VCHA38O210_40117 [Vibrio chagasii]